ncbi:unnamed protein product [Discosporangium mesarthrocarpum]
MGCHPTCSQKGHKYVRSYPEMPAREVVSSPVLHCAGTAMSAGTVQGVGLCPCWEEIAAQSRGEEKERALILALACKMCVCWLVAAMYRSTKNIAEFPPNPVGQAWQLQAQQTT